jgi:hypothetical protein
LETLKAISLLADGKPLFKADSITKGLTSVEQNNLTNLLKEFDTFLTEYPLLKRFDSESITPVPNSELLVQLSGAGPNDRVATLSARADAVALRHSKVWEPFKELTLMIKGNSDMINYIDELVALDNNENCYSLAKVVAVREKGNKLRLACIQNY